MQSLSQKWNLKWFPQKLKVKWSPELSQDLKSFHLLEEFEKCSKCPIYFIEKYVKNPKNGEPIKLSNNQKFLLENFEKKSKVSIVKERQVGCSYILALYAFWKCLFSDNYKVLMCFHNKDICKIHKNNILEILQSLPENMKKSVVRDSNWSIQLKNGSQINFETPNLDSLCSDSYQLIIFDEFTYFKNLEEVYMVAHPTCSEKFILCGECDRKFYEKYLKEFTYLHILRF